MKVEQVCRLAREAGLSYGQFVFLHPEEANGPDPAERPRGALTRCACCGRIFRAQRRSARFCGDFCRLLFWRGGPGGEWQE